MGSLFYHEHKYLSGTKHSVKVMKPWVSRPSTFVNDDNIEKVKDTVLENRCVGIREVAENLKITYEYAQPFINVMGMNCLNVRLVLKDLHFLKKGK